MCTYIQIHTLMCTYTYRQIQIHTKMYIYNHTNTHPHTDTYVHTFTHKHISTYGHIHAFIYINTQTWMHTDTDILTCMCAHTYPSTHHIFVKQTTASTDLCPMTSSCSGQRPSCLPGLSPFCPASRHPHHAQGPDVLGIWWYFGSGWQ